MRQQKEAKEEEHRRELEKREKGSELLRQHKEEEHKRELDKKDKDMEMLKMQMTMGKDAKEGTTINVHKPKLPKFEEGKDDMDTYLQQYERFAKTQKWKNDKLVANLSPLLTGKGLEVYTSMPDDDIDNYEQLKIALLKRYQLTEEGCRRRFRESNVDKGETVYQFVARLCRYFRRWVELSGIKKNYEALEDLMVREQYITTCGKDLALFLRERLPKDMKEMIKLAEQYIEARDTGSVINNNSAAAVYPSYRPVYGERQCYICHRTNHIARDCYYREQNPRYANNTGGEQSQNMRPQETNNSREQKGLSVIEWNIPHMIGNNSVRVGGESKTRMPVCEGLPNNKTVMVLRDTGCSSAAVKTSLVEGHQMTGEYVTCVLIDGTQRQFPLAHIWVDTPYFTGEVEAMCMEDPLYDLILGNIPSVSNVPDPTWRIEGNAITTRAQQEKSKKPIQPLKVPTAELHDVNMEKLIKEQKQDKTLKKTWQRVEQDDEGRAMLNGSWRIEVKDGVLTRVYEDSTSDSPKIIKQVVVPQLYRNQVMKLAHEAILGGHLGAKKTTDRVTSSFYWPGITSDIRRFCQSCDQCQRMMPKGKNCKVPLGEMPLMGEPFERIAVDLIGPIKPITEQGNRCILTIVDFATRYPEAIPLRSIETERVAEALMSVFCRLGFPKEILSDRGSQFTSELMKEISRLISMKQLFTTPYNPLCNGLVEKMNGTLKSMLRKMCQEKPKDWDRYLQAVLFAYREVPQTSTGFSPFELLYGRTVRGPMQILKALWTEEEDSDVRNTYQYIIDLKNRLEETCKLAKENLCNAQGEHKHYYDKKTRKRNFKVGTKVLLLLPTDHNKLILQWKGPFEVVEVIDRMDYKIQMGNDTKVFHANLLKEYIEREDKKEQEECSVAIIDEELHEDVGAVKDEEIIEFCENGGKESYKDVSMDETLVEEKKMQLKGIVSKYLTIFTDLPGTTSLAEHVIDTTTREAVRVKPYPTPYAVRETVEEEVQKMLDMGVIEPACSPYNSPVVLVKKKDNSTRFCIDFRRLNAVTRFDTHPMGNTEDILAKVKNDAYFTKIDLAKGYWQIPVAKDSQAKTSFVTSNGSYQFLKMPFGLVNSGSTFNRMMRKLLNGVENVDHYVDDILIHTTSWNEHLKAIQEVLERIKHSGLTIRPSKCLMGYSTMDFTGHVVGNGSVTTESDKIERIKEAARPKTKKQVRSFLGLVGFYRKFIPNFATISVPLTDLTKKGAPNVIRWDQSHEKAFATLKDKLMKSPVLRLPDFEKDIIIRSDASDVGIGVVLLQECEDGVFPIAYMPARNCYLENGIIQ